MSINQPLTIAQVATGTLNVTGGISASPGSKSVTFAGPGAINVTTSAIADGTGTVTVTVTGGTTTLSAASTYTGLTNVNAGVVNIQNASTLGSTAAGTVVANGATLQLQGGIAVGGEALSLIGVGVGSDGGLRNISGNNTWAGTIALTGNTTIQSDAGTLTIDVASGNAF